MSQAQLDNLLEKKANRVIAEACYRYTHTADVVDFLNGKVKRFIQLANSSFDTNVKLAYYILARLIKTKVDKLT